MVADSIRTGDYNNGLTKLSHHFNFRKKSNLRETIGPKKDRNQWKELETKALRERMGQIGRAKLTGHEREQGGGFGGYFGIG